MAGLYTHYEISYRVLKCLDNSIQDKLRGYEDYYHSGAFFPDWGYTPENFNKANDTIVNNKYLKNIPGIRDALHKVPEVNLKYRPAGEDSHWAPFFLAGVNLEKASERLAAFLLGTVVHNLVDAMWHTSLGGYVDDGKDEMFEIKADIRLQLYKNTSFSNVNIMFNKQDILSVYDALIKEANITKYSRENVDEMLQPSLDAMTDYMLMIHAIPAVSLVEKVYSLPDIDPVIDGLLVPIIVSRLSLFTGVLYNNEVPEQLYTYGKNLPEIIKGFYGAIESGGASVNDTLTRDKTLQVDFSMNENYFGNLSDQYVDTNELYVPDGKVAIGFKFRKKGNRLAPALLVSKPDGSSHEWIQNDDWGDNYFGKLSDQYADTNKLDVPKGKIVTGFKFWQKGNRLAPAIRISNPDGSDPQWVQNSNMKNGDGSENKNYFGKLSDQYADTNELILPPGGKMNGFMICKKNNRIAPIIWS